MMRKKISAVMQPHILNNHARNETRINIKQENSAIQDIFLQTSTLNKKCEMCYCNVVPELFEKS